MQNIVIREARPADSEAMNRILSDVSRNSPEVDFKKITSGRPRSGENANLVAEVDGEIIGFMISYIFDGGFGLERSAWIATLGVSPACMGKGVGTLLARELMSIYRRRSVKHLFTAVRWDSVDLLSFFKTLGFDRSDFINLGKKL
ncbi:MAG TPA: GNAT family N-acetyltransferase [Desulfobacteraceae bacterium]|mgnify:CR=1 FL=1|nr:GNAT family N-acetyltransferase [Desulfobacteraceae bacterium]